MRQRPTTSPAISLAAMNRHPQMVLLTTLALSAPLVTACSFSQEPSRPVIATFEAEPHDIHQGAMTTLTWSLHAHPEPSITIDQGVGEVVNYLGHVHVAPNSTTTYAIVAANNHGTDTATTTVTVHPPVEPDALEPDDDETSAIRIGSTYLSPIRTITPGDVDWYTFTLDGPAFVTVWLQTEALGSLLVSRYRVLDADLVSLALYGDGLHPHDEDRRPLSLDVGTYFVVVTGMPLRFDFSGAHQRAGIYRLVVSATPE
jgi:hypothetical protein